MDKGRPNRPTRETTNQSDGVVVQQYSTIFFPAQQVLFITTTYGSKHYYLFVGVQKKLDAQILNFLCLFGYYLLSLLAAAGS